MEIKVIMSVFSYALISYDHHPLSVIMMHLWAYSHYSS